MKSTFFYFLALFLFESYQLLATRQNIAIVFVH